MKLTLESVNGPVEIETKRMGAIDAAALCAKIFNIWGKDAVEAAKTVYSLQGGVDLQTFDVSSLPTGILDKPELASTIRALCAKHLVTIDDKQVTFDPNELFAGCLDQLGILVAITLKEEFGGFFKRRFAATLTAQFQKK